MHSRLIHFSKRISYLGFYLLIISCTNTEKKNVETIKIASNTQAYVYTIDNEGVSIVWTAYKFTERESVYGTFKDFELSNKSEYGSIERTLTNLKLSIRTASVETDNEIRDFKLRTYFFEPFNTSVITGTIITSKEGEGIVRVTLNGKPRKLPYTYALSNDSIVLFTHINLANWGGKMALWILSEECYEIAQGDSITKLWPDVDITIKLPVYKKLRSEL